MKNLYLSSVLLVASFVAGQNVYQCGFGSTDEMTTGGWTLTNQSTLPSGTWKLGTYTAVTVSATVPATPFQNTTYAIGQVCPIPLDQTGAPNSFALANYQSTSSTAATGATISNWMISGPIVVSDGDVVSFYTRIGKYPAAAYADNLELRMSLNGGLSVAPSTGPTDVGDFTDLLVEINPNLNLTSYPTAWTKYSYSLEIPAGLGVAEFAFRYYVPNAGTNGQNSDIIGVDSFSIDHPQLGSSDVVRNNFEISPNPAHNVLYIKNKNQISINGAFIVDMNARIVKEIDKNLLGDSISITDLETGVYFIKISTSQGVSTTKLIKD